MRKILFITFFIFFAKINYAQSITVSQMQSLFGIDEKAAEDSLKSFGYNFEDSTNNDTSLPFKFHYSSSWYYKYDSSRNKIILQVHKTSNKVEEVQYIFSDKDEYENLLKT